MSRTSNPVPRLRGRRHPIRPGCKAPQDATQAKTVVTTFSAPPKVTSEQALLGPYRIEAKLGEGGMGAVYKATHTRLQKVVALKVLPPNLAKNADFIARFDREMMAIGKLEHPNIVRAMDAGEVDGTHDLAMEYVDGVDLARYVHDRGPMTAVNACRVIRQVATALATAHAAGLVHRDIKPGNLLLTKANGQVKVLDLGLALVADAHSPTTELTAVGQTFGTPDYMAPEQWEDSHSVDPRVDLYALGCTLFYLLTGRAPYATENCRSTVAKMRAHVDGEIPDLQSLVPHLPDGVNAIYRRLMAKRPEDRFPTAAALVDALAPYSSGKGLIPSSTASSSQSSSDATAVISTFQSLSGDAPSALLQERRTELRRRRELRQQQFLVYGSLGGLAIVALLVGALYLPRTPSKDATGKGLPSIAEAQVETTAPAQPPMDPERRAAEWTIRQGGSVDVWTKDGLMVVRELARIPPGRIIVDRVDLPTLPANVLDQLNVRRGLKAARQLRLYQTLVGDDDLKRIGPQPLLERLDLCFNASVTELGIRALGPCDRLHDLQVAATGISRDFWPWVVALPQLTDLNASGCG